MEVWKLQIPIASTDPEPKILAYPKSNPADMFYLPMEKKYMQWFPHGSKVTYVYAKVNMLGKLVIKSSAPWSDGSW